MIVPTEEDSSSKYEYGVFDLPAQEENEEKSVLLTHTLVANDHPCEHHTCEKLFGRTTISPAPSEPSVRRGFAAAEKQVL